MGLLTNYKKTEVVVEKIKKNKSNFDYSEFNSKETEILIELEGRALYTGNLISENLKELSDVFTEAQKIFSNNKNGSFGKWYENLGFKKDFVYLCLDRKNLAIKYAKKEVYKLPDRAVKELKRYDNSNENDIVFEILEAEKPSEKLKEIKEAEKKKKEKSFEIGEYKDDEIGIKEGKIKKEIITKLFSLGALMNKNEISDKKNEILEILDKLEKILKD